MDAQHEQSNESLPTAEVLANLRAARDADPEDVGIAKLLEAYEKLVALDEQPPITFYRVG